MRANAVRAANSIIARSSISARTPRRQATPSAKAQLQIRIRLTILNLAARRRSPPRPTNTLTARIRRLNRNTAPIKPIAKDIRQVVPDRLAVEVVAEDRLADIRLEDAVFLAGDLERDAAGFRIPVECLAVGLVFFYGDLWAHGAAYGPEVDGCVALVCHDCTADGVGGAGDEAEGCERGEKHFAVCLWVNVSECMNGVLGLVDDQFGYKR